MKTKIFQENGSLKKTISAGLSAVSVNGVMRIARWNPIEVGNGMNYSWLISSIGPKL